jgi:hypothetical protein
MNELLELVVKETVPASEFHFAEMYRRELNNLLRITQANGGPPHRACGGQRDGIMMSMMSMLGGKSEEIDYIERNGLSYFEATSTYMPWLKRSQLRAA